MAETDTTTTEEQDEKNPVKLNRFELPNRLVKDEDTATDTYARFVAEPFEQGFGHTIGNSLRRVLLSSLEGAAITSVRIAGVRAATHRHWWSRRCIRVPRSALHDVRLLRP